MTSTLFPPSSSTHGRSQHLHPPTQTTPDFGGPSVSVTERTRLGRETRSESITNTTTHAGGMLYVNGHSMNRGEGSSTSTGTGTGIGGGQGMKRELSMPGLGTGTGTGSTTNGHQMGMVNDTSGNESTPGPSGTNGPSETNGTNLNTDTTSTATGTNGNGEGKKRKKKGWKGWAMVIEDAQGNVIEVNDGPDPGPLPPRRPRSKVRQTSPVLIDGQLGIQQQQQQSSTRKKSKSKSPLVMQRELTIDSVLSEPEILPVSKRRRRDDDSVNNTSNGTTSTLSLGPRNQPHLPNGHASQRQGGDERQPPLSASPNNSPYAQPQPLSDHDTPAPAPSYTATAPKQARHSLPKSKTKLPRPLTVNAPARTKPNRDTQPTSSRATPALDDGTRIALPRLPRSGMGTVENGNSESDVRTEAAYIIAQAAKHREEAILAGGNHIFDETVGTPPLVGQSSSSSARYNIPSSPPQSTSTLPDPVPQHPAYIYGDNDDDDDDDFETAFEKVKEAYRNGIQPHNNAKAPQVLSVPINGMEDAHPPEWLPDQRPAIVLALGRDRLLPNGKDEVSHQQGFDGLNPDLETDAQGFVDNVADNLQNILMYYFPQPSPRRDAFLERIGRGLADFGWRLTDSSSACLPPPPKKKKR